MIPWLGVDDRGVVDQFQTRIRICFSPQRVVGRDSSVGIAIRYRLDGPGIESRWGQDFPHPSRPALGLTQPPIKWVPDLPRG
jgi:hypothetical protein